MMRRQVLEATHGFDPEYYLYGEDMDFCWRAKLAGWKVVYFPGAVITHFGGQGGNRQEENLRDDRMACAMWIFYRKHRAPTVAFSPRSARLVLFRHRAQDGRSGRRD